MNGHEEKIVKYDTVTLSVIRLIVIHLALNLQLPL